MEACFVKGKSPARIRGCLADQRCVALVTGDGSWSSDRAGAGREAEGCARAGHPQQDACHGGSPEGRAPPAGHRLLLHRHQPSGPGGGFPFIALYVFAFQWTPRCPLVLKSPVVSAHFGGTLGLTTHTGTSGLLHIVRKLAGRDGLYWNLNLVCSVTSCLDD